MLAKRLLSSAVGILLLFFFVLNSSNIFGLGILAVTIVALYEFFNVLRVNSPWFRVFSLGYLLILPVILYTNNYKIFELSLFLVTFISFSMVILNYNKNKISDIFFTLISILFIILPFSYLYKIHSGPNGVVFIWLVFIGGWITDTFAYFVGRGIGKHKLTPISPKKTIEGAIGGFLGNILITVAFGYFIGLKFNINYSLYHYLIIGIISGITSQIGDLSASLVKRSVDVKDFGGIMPGHGGILDRFDSILFTAPAIYFYLYFVMNIK